MLTGSLFPRLVGGLLLPWFAACGGEDLLLPGSGTPAGLEAVSGDRQEGQVGATLPDPLVVRATDAAGRPVQGATIVFQFDGDVGGQVAPDTARTDAEGQAAAEVRLGTTSGAQLVDALVVEEPSDLVVTFRLTAVASPGGGGGDGGGGEDGGGNSGGGGNRGGGGNGGDDDRGGGRGGDDDDDDDDDDFDD